MTGVEVTQEDRRAYLSLNMVSPHDKAAIMSGDWDAVHGMQVLALHRQHARTLALEEAAVLCESYAEINMEICGDNIILDPVLRGEGFDEENMLRSEHHQNMSLIHSSKYHASTELAISIRSLSRSGGA